MSVLHLQKVSGTSGSEAHLLQLLPALRSRGFDVRFLMLHEAEPAAWEFARALERAGVPVDGLELRGDLDPRTFGRLYAHLRRARPDILHTHLVHADAYGLPAAALARIPIRLSTKHGFNTFRSGRLFALGDRALGRLAHAQIAISHGLARYLASTEGFSESSFEVIHYGIAVQPLALPPRRGEPRFLSIGRLIPIKGQDILLRAFRRVLDRRPDARLEIAGHGELERELRDLSAALGLERAVSFLGQVSPVQPVIEQASVVVVPSRGEGFGMVALEAMERGRPVVATAVGGLSDLVKHGVTGLLTPPENAEALAESMLTLAGDPARAETMGAAGRVRALEQFEQSRCTDRTEALYRSWLERRGFGPAGPA